MVPSDSEAAHTGAAKWILAGINSFMYTCASPSVTFHNACEKWAKVQ